MSYVTKSPWIIHYDGSSCNGCDIEVLACLTPMYDVERFGIINTGNPKHADIFLITGSINEQNISVVKQIYEQMPEPKIVVAIGICATSGGIFRECYNIMGGVDTVIPVDVYVPGCAARPEAIIDGVVKGLGVLAEKRANMPKRPVAAVTEAAAEQNREADQAIEVRYYGKTDEEDELIDASGSVNVVATSAPAPAVNTAPVASAPAPAANTAPVANAASAPANTAGASEPVNENIANYLAGLKAEKNDDGKGEA